MTARRPRPGRTSGPDPRRPGYDAVLLAGFGGPEGPDDVMPFLRNVTRGRGIPEERLVEVSHHYQALGGSSPINEQNRALRAALAAELATPRRRRAGAVGQPELGALSGRRRRGGPPRRPGPAARRWPRRRTRRYSSCRQYREDFGMALAGHRSRRQRCGSTRCARTSTCPGFVAPFVDGTVGGPAMPLRRRVSEIAELEVVFTTHSIPLTMADTSGSRTSATTDRRRLRRAAPGRVRAGGHDRCAHGPALRSALAAGLPVPVRPAVGAVAGARHQRRDHRARRGRAARAWSW